MLCSRSSDSSDYHSNYVLYHVQDCWASLWHDFWYFSRISKHDSLSWKFYSYGTGCYYGIGSRPYYANQGSHHFCYREIEQTIEGRFVSPLVLGNKLSIHPITIMFILLTAGSLYGVWGVLLGIPIYASVKVIVKDIFDWYRSVSNLYQDDIEIKGQKYDVK